MNVLIVDDNANDRKILRYTLEHHGCEVTEAKDGQEGFELAKRLQLDLIVSDALMPRMDGFEFLRMVKMDDKLRSIPFVFHSAVYTGLKDKELALSLGAEAFIGKPMEPEGLWEELASILQKCAAEIKIPAVAKSMEGEEEYLRKYGSVVAAKVGEKVRELEQNIVERKLTEEALRESELQRYRLQAEIACAAEMQARLLPGSYPDLPDFEFAARCLPARQVGGDFYDWIVVASDIIAITLGDVMGKGMSAAMLMTTAMAAIHAATLQNGPAAAVQLAELAIRSNLERFESFVTLFHAHLNVRARTMTYVDCGHGYVFLRRSDGTVEELSPRGLPLGVMAKEQYQEGMLTFEPGDTLVLYSDGLIDASPELALNNQILAGHLGEAATAREMLAILLALPMLKGPPPDDLTVLVIRAMNTPPG
ncbi:MAG: SpoIIE family protein phosphatase [Deltaproteobacteria bacterium]|nr:SpoIIE family protein phosphatase [Deltaproteobacteria bacterium]